MSLELILVALDLSDEGLLRLHILELFDAKHPALSLESKRYADGLRILELSLRSY